MKEINYKRGEKVDVAEEFGVIEINKDKYIGKKPLVTPKSDSRGVYGGNIVGQSLLVAMKSCDPEFKPHSLHSSFVRAATTDSPLIYEVEEISNGNNFCNRSVKAFQNDKIVFYANISLTKKNALKESMAKYEEYNAKYEKKLKEKEFQVKENNDNEDDDQDDDEEVEKKPIKPFGFQTPLHNWFQKYDLNELPVSGIESNMLSYFKFFPDFLFLNKSEYENDIPVAERKFAFLVRWGIDNEQGYDQPLINVDSQFKYVGLGNLSDSLLLNVILRVLRIENVDLKDYHKTFFGVSLDHVLYIHDDDFDVTKWMGYSFKTIRFSHDRILVEGEIYNDKGVHVASVIQEGLLKFEGKEKGAKL
ncbi:uncharacterized protein KGF55_001748 [Candida pseudojiufengensis]|uniref:uncharacterized protein n=1 Tax=Candida pseudojiufengensis TaxID=497109 RepID=UPI0022242FF4|nr:uncharacterized protein KGF55_001748 [Candida pseudojiufengensis]KAI5964679.1 hypothetical protein KGF55_001748 [Candida pseudojiufengensis]